MAHLNRAANLGKYARKGFASPKKGTRYSQSAEARARRVGVMPAGAKHTAWKGDRVGYDALHAWVGRKLGKPDKCEICETTGLKGREIDWANRSGRYQRDLSDWIRLCRPCHGRYDKEHGMRQRTRACRHLSQERAQTR